jgi:hypothetical protein
LECLYCSNGKGGYQKSSAVARRILNGVGIDTPSAIPYNPSEKSRYRAEVDFKAADNGKNQK